MVNGLPTFVLSLLFSLFIMNHACASKRECPPIEDADLYPGAWKKAVNRIIGYQDDPSPKDENRMDTGEDEQEILSPITYEQLLESIKDESSIRQLTDSTAKMRVEFYEVPNPAYNIFDVYKEFPSLK